MHRGRASVSAPAARVSTAYSDLLADVRLNGGARPRMQACVGFSRPGVVRRQDQIRCSEDRMSFPVHCLIALATSFAASMPTFAAAADALDAKAEVPPLTHRSAFSGYRRFADEASVPWKQANDTVGRIGGWRAYAREAALPETSLPAPAPASGAPPAAGAAEPASAPTRHRHAKP
jgi:hypothetical protein